MVIQAALAVLLSKLSASTDVAVGFPIAGRGDPALDELVGFFVNTLVLRVDLAGDPTVAELLAQVRAAQPGRLRAPRRALRGARGAAQPHPMPDPSPAGPGDVGLAELRRAGQRPRRRAGLGDLQVTPLPVDTHTARMDLAFSLAERWTEAGEPAGIGGAVEFRTDVFDAASIEALIERLQRVLVAMTADPTRRLSSMDLLDAGEHARLDESGNRAVLTQPAPAPVSIPALFAAQVARDPGGGGGELRGPLVDLPRARGGRQPVGAPAGRPWCGPRAVCGAAVFALGRGDRGDSGGAEDRGGVSADRPGAAGGADRVHACRCRAGRRDHHRRAGRRGWTGATCWSSMSTTPRLTPTQHRLAGAGPR